MGSEIKRALMEEDKQNGGKEGRKEGVQMYLFELLTNEDGHARNRVVHDHDEL